MTQPPSAGWREVYDWLHVPMTQRLAAVSGEAGSGTTLHETMSDRHNQRMEAEKYAKRKLQEIVGRLENAQESATLEQIVEEIDEVNLELAYVKTQIKEES